jgi:hypothetical protein
MDLAKMLAVLDLITPLEGPSFRVWRQTRTGLLSYPLDLDAARAHLATSVYTQMEIWPQIVHVVGHTEAHHAATASDVIEACKLAQRAIENALRGFPDTKPYPHDVHQRRDELVQEAETTLSAIHALAGSHVDDPLIDPPTLARAVALGILDAPHLKNNPYARGQVASQIDKRGACVAVHPDSGNILTEKGRIELLQT